MDSFHCFPMLPGEIQLLIWWHAIRPLAEGYSGIQKFSFRPNNLPESDTGSQIRWAMPKTNIDTGWAHDVKKRKPFLLSIPGTDEEEERHQTNRSAYLYDAGLWGACWDSRKTIMQHGEMAEGLEVSRNRTDIEARRKYSTKLYATMKAPPLRANSSQETWHLMVRPFQDAFNLDLNSLADVANQYNEYRPAHCYWSEIFSQYPFSATTKGEGRAVDLIFEFDTNWNCDLPTDWMSLVSEQSPRGYLAALLERYGHRGRYLSVWLIDRDLYESSSGLGLQQSDCRVPGAISGMVYQQGSSPRSWEEGGTLGGAPRVFYNCDEVFVEIDNDKRRHGLSYKFMRELTRLKLIYELSNPRMSGIPSRNMSPYCFGIVGLKKGGGQGDTTPRNTSKELLGKEEKGQ